MDTKNTLSAIFVSAALLGSAPLFAQAGHVSHHPAKNGVPAAAPAPGKLLPVTEKEAAWAAKERKTYPLDVCVVSGEKLGGMGKPADYIYRVEGKPDRLVLFCCDGCDEDFLKDPATSLAKLDAAKAGKSKDTGAANDAHEGHH